MNCKSLWRLYYRQNFRDLFVAGWEFPQKGGKVREFLPKFLLHNSGLGRIVAICPGYTNFGWRHYSRQLTAICPSWPLEKMIFVPLSVGSLDRPILWSEVLHLHILGLYLRSTPHPVTVTTRIITYLVGNPYKPSFATVTGWGVDPNFI